MFERNKNNNNSEFIIDNQIDDTLELKDKIEFIWFLYLYDDYIYLHCYVLKKLAKIYQIIFNCVCPDNNSEIVL